jgi:hypothetical protein
MNLIENFPKLELETFSRTFEFFLNEIKLIIIILLNSFLNLHAGILLEACHKFEEALGTPSVEGREGNILCAWAVALMKLSKFADQDFEMATKYLKLALEKYKLAAGINSMYFLFWFPVFSCEHACFFFLVSAFLAPLGKYKLLRASTVCWFFFGVPPAGSTVCFFFLVSRLPCSSFLRSINWLQTSTVCFDFFWFPPSLLLPPTSYAYASLHLPPPSSLRLHHPPSPLL